jgi:hypothetical protein
MAITTKTFQNLQPGVQRVDDLRVRRPINEALQWLGEGLVDELNTHFDAISASISAISATISAINSLGLHKKWIPSKEMHPAAVNGAAVGAIVATPNAQNYYTLDFDQATNEIAFFTWSMPSSWDEGTVTYRAVWGATSATTSMSGDVVWLLDGTALSDGDALGSAFGTPAGVTDTWLGDRINQRSGESTAITIAGTPAANDLVNYRVRRNANNVADTLNADAQLIGIELFYTTAAAVDVA